MFRKLILSVALTLCTLTMAGSTVQAQQLFAPQPVHVAQDCCWTERVFAISLRAHWFANTMERRGYIVQVNRRGLFQWSVRYRHA